MTTDIVHRGGKHPTRHRVARTPDTTRLPRLGKIRLGHIVPAKGTKPAYPAKDDHFVVVEDGSGITTAEAVAAFREVYGEQPKRLRAMLPAHTPQECLESAYRLYGQSKIKRICNGASCSVKTDTGWQDGPCQCRADGLDPDASPHPDDACSLIHTLNIVLPDVRGLGVWQIDSKSEIGERQVGDFLDHIYNVRGTLMRFEFDLELVAVKVNPVTLDRASGELKARPGTVYVLRPVPVFDVTPRDAITAAAESRVAAEPRRELPAPTVDAERDPRISPTRSEEAAAEIAQQPLHVAVAESWKNLSDEGKGELVAHLGLEKLASTKPLIERWGEDARDLEALLEQIHADHAGATAAGGVDSPTSPGELEQLPMSGAEA